MVYGEKQSINVTEDELKQYLDVLEINGIGNEWKYSVDKCILQPYLQHLHWHITFRDTLEYLKILKDKHSLSYYRKEVYQIRKFLEYHGIGWSKKLNPPPEPQYLPKRITSDAIKDSLSHFENNEYFLQVKAIILLGTTSGMRAEELFQLTLDDIDLDNRIVRINHNPDNGQSTKTKQSRISFFTEEAKHALTDYIGFYQHHNGLKCLFSQTHIERLFRFGKASIQVKDLRKYYTAMG
jgi:integrase